MAVCLPQHGLYCSVIVRMESIWCREETAHNFCLSTCPFAVPPHGLTHSIVVASFLSGHFFASINSNPTVQSFTEFFIFEGQWQPDMYSEEREDPVETDGKC